MIVYRGTPSEKPVESHEVVVPDRRGYNCIKMLAIHRNALMTVENLPKSVVNFSDDAFTSILDLVDT
jgi:hypothetical protein